MPTEHIPCYVVNLSSDVERRTRVQETLESKGIEPIFFNAVDGRLLPQEELDQHINQPLLSKEYGSISKGEAGCALSHIGVYRDIVEQGHRVVAILEDDVCVEENFGRLLDPASPEFVGLALSEQHPEMLQMTRVGRGYRFTEKKLGQHHSTIRPSCGVWLTSGYIINLAGARSLAENLYPLWAVADYWNRFQEKGLIHIRALTPPAVWESGLGKASNLSPERTRRRRHKKTFFQRLQRIGQDIVRPVLTRRL